MHFKSQVLNVKGGNGGGAMHLRSFSQMMAYFCPKPIFPPPFLTHLGEFLESGGWESPWVGPSSLS